MYGSYCKSHVIDMYGRGRGSRGGGGGDRGGGGSGGGGGRGSCRIILLFCTIHLLMSIKFARYLSLC